jgi:hypothetical protein
MSSDPHPPSLRDRLLGTWRLLSYRTEAEDGSVRHPLGRDLQGLLVYAPDGFVSVQLMRPGRAPYASGDVGGGSRDERAAAAAGYFAYAGTYETDEARQSVIHRVRLSLVPNWVGDVQTRIARFDAGELELSAPRLLIGARMRIARLRWTRAAV